MHANEEIGTKCVAFSAATAARNCQSFTQCFMQPTTVASSGKQP